MAMMYILKIQWWLWIGWIWIPILMITQTMFMQTLLKRVKNWVVGGGLMTNLLWS